MIRTVRGDVHPDNLGITYPHEHLITAPPPNVHDPDLAMPDLDRAVEELGHFRRAGGRALVEMTTPDYGRDVRALCAASEAADVHVIATTGYIKESFFHPLVDGKRVEELAKGMIQEITVGVGETGIRAGVIKAGSSQSRITRLERNVFLAAAQAHHATGAPISTHTEAGTMALEQAALLIKEGVPPGRILIGHMDRCLDLNYHLRVAQTGVCLGFDQFSKEKYYPDLERIRVIKQLIAAGHDHQIVLSGDLARRSYWPSYSGGPGLSYVLWRVVPWMREEGVVAASIYEMLIHTPARLLSLRGRE